ncbi:MAG TPA: hypothetical protein VFN44_07695 [Solirubrobacteraceae bacterium]|nr:hypothetical protein [Solirubrobacteraceae bacterium]
MTIRRTLAAALAATAIAAPAASAQPADTHLPTAQAQQRQDLRGEHARDAALHPEDAPLIRSRLAPFSGPVSPGHPSEAGNTTSLPPLDVAARSADDDGVDWPTLGLGIAGLVLFMGGVVALATRRPTPGPRVSV